MLFKSSRWNFAIDDYLNPWVPSPPWQYMPYVISRFLGYRPSPTQPLNHGLIILWATLGVFLGLTLIEAVGQQIPSFQAHGTPVIIGSFGAAAVLEFYAIESPLAQPRNAVISQVLASVIGVCIRKLFELGSGSMQLIWLGGSLSCALTTAAMALTGTVHPPAGATALLAVVDSGVAALGFFLIPVMLFGCGLMQSAALLLNNVQRKFPMYWWSPEEVGSRWRGGTRVAVDRDIESGSIDAKASSEAVHDHHEGGGVSDDSSSRVIVSRSSVKVSEGVYITPEEAQFLEELCQRL